MRLKDCITTAVLCLTITTLAFAENRITRSGAGSNEIEDPEVEGREARAETNCRRSFGTRFNLESRTNALGQGAGPIDFIPNRTASGVDLVVGTSFEGRGENDGRPATIGYYVNRDADCPPEFEGLFPAGGDAHVVADPARDVFFLAFQSPLLQNSVFALRSPAESLLNSVACPNGTHRGEEITTCWPTLVEIIGRSCSEGGCASVVEARLRVDERTSGTGAGDVYIAANVGNINVDNGIRMVACTNDLQMCSSEIKISADDADVNGFGIGTADVKIRPDGKITFVYQKGLTVPDLQIRYVTCTPHGAPNPPTCSEPVTVAQELNFYNKLPAQNFFQGVSLSHTHRVDPNGTETYVLWDRCKLPPLCLGFPAECRCSDSDIVMKASNNDGATWSELTAVDTGPQDQFRSRATTDRSRNVVYISFYSSTSDPIFRSRTQVHLRQIQPGNATPDPVGDEVAITRVPTESFMESAGTSPFDGLGGAFTPEIGISARGNGASGQSRVYIHHSSSNIQGVYNGIRHPDQNNHLSRLDTGMRHGDRDTDGKRRHH